jgi:hypothetical protein
MSILAGRESFYDINLFICKSLRYLQLGTKVAILFVPRVKHLLVRRNKNHQE